MISPSFESHPTRVRGLKQAEEGTKERGARVAPHAGAWIETGLGWCKGWLGHESHPTRVRGLKQLLWAGFSHFFWSHPTRVRGLKLRLAGIVFRAEKVAPHAGAWIETWLAAVLAVCWGGRTPRGCVD